MAQIWYKVDTIHWFYVLSIGFEWLVIKEYVLKGLLSECLFLLNSWGVHKIATYWLGGIYLVDYVHPWVMTKEHISTGLGYYILEPKEFEYMQQVMIDALGISENVMQPPPASPLVLPLPIL